MSEKGPTYGVELIDILHAPGCMRQAMPSRSDLLGIKNYRQGQRVVAGYEVLLNHWRAQAKEIKRLENKLLDLIEELARSDWEKP